MIKRWLIFRENKLAQQKFEIEKLLKKIEALKRNYEGLSNSAISEKNDYLRLKRENEQYILEMQNLRENNQELSMREKQYRDELESLLDSNKQYKEQVEQITSESRLKSEENKKLKKHYEDKIKDLTASNKKLSETYQKNREDMNLKDDEIKILNDKIAELNKEITAFKQNSNENEIRVKIEGLNKENNSLKEQIQALQQLIESNQKEYIIRIERLEVEKQEAINKINAGMIDFYSSLMLTLKYYFIDQSESLKTEIEGLTNQLQESQDKTNDLTKNVDTLNKELAALKEQLSNKNKELSERDDIIAELKKQIEEQNNEIDSMKSGASQEHNAVKEKIVILEKHNTELANKLSFVERVQQDLDSKLKAKTQEYNDLEKSNKNKLEMMYNDMEKIKKMSKDEISEANQKLEQMKKKIGEIDLEKQKALNDNTSLKSQLDGYKKRIEDYNAFKEAIIVIIKKVLKNYESINSNLSWLSWLEFLQSPLMLICGHSIWMKWFNAHSDPNSKDSIVFWEEWKIETKNKELMESKVIEILCDKFSASKKSVTEALTLVNQLNPN